VSSPTIFFPVNQREQAAQSSSEVLLADMVYQQLAVTVREALFLAKQARRAGDEHDDVNHLRAHTAVLIDGSRGTGKSSVLVNIDKYLRQHDPVLAEKVHFLKPLDPTLLETSDDLFLNVIVAGLVCDKDIQEARLKDDVKANYFLEQLQGLGNTLERLEAQRELRGLDKLRAFMGNQNLAQEVHQVFKAALDLVDKELLVLPIDDVDTSLNHAFANLEVIRKYLVSPYVLPVISGDLTLYDDLTWRNFHGKLLEESPSERDEAKDRAKDLAREYQRKVLPLQYRIEMPEVMSYLRSGRIGFHDDKGRAISGLTMAHFHSWLEAILNERTNGTENSYLVPPVKNVRSLAQLVYTLQHYVPRLARTISTHDLDPSHLRRQLVVPVAASAMQSFKEAYAAANRIIDKSGNESARRDAYKALTASGQDAVPAHPELRKLARVCQRALKDYCQFAAEGGPAYLTLEAQRYWWGFVAPNRSRDDSVLDTFLFQPMSHREANLRHFGAQARTTTWQEIIGERAPLEWIQRLPSMTVLPYPAPEPGYVLTKGKTNFGDPRANFAADLLLHRNFYTTTKRATLVCCGRVFELVVASFVSDVTSEEIAYLLQRAPFHSLAAVAATKTQTIAGADDYGQEDEVQSDDTAAVDAATLHAAQIEQLAGEIAAWRERHALAGHSPAPWFFYNVMNKVFNQAAIFNAPPPRGGNPDKNGQAYLAKLSPKIFNSIWAAIGSFEKGELFGLPPIIAQVNVGDGKTFRNSELYTRNIAPFVGSRTEADAFGRLTRSYTHMMADHPLRLLMETPAEFATAMDNPGEVAAKPRRERDLSSPLLEYLNQRLDTQYTIFRTSWILNQLREHPKRQGIINSVVRRFKTDRYYDRFLQVLNSLR
jgi:hypothetical protein